MKTVTSTMVDANVEFTIKSIKRTGKYGNKTYFEVELKDGKFSNVMVCKNNAWNYTMIDRDKELKIIYNDDFAFHFNNLITSFEMIDRFEQDLNLGRGKDW